MVFTAWPFPLFLLIVWSVYWLLRNDAGRKWWLLLASYVFYGAWDWRFLGLIWLSTAVDYIAAWHMSSSVAETARRRWLKLSLVTNLGILGFFKYFDFFADSAQQLAGRCGLSLSVPVLDIVLPVGISFYTFQTLSYTIDVYRGQLRPVRSLRDFALFVAFFPQLVAGPIVRAAEFLPQLERPRSWSDVEWRWAWTLILLGFIKKACLADHFGVVADPVFDDPGGYASADLALAAVLYAAQIFCDFSGYSDIAIGTAWLFGYRLPTNFRAPYVARSVSEFWHRWHMSLSTWLRDYLYIPLGGSRCSIARRDANLLATMVLGGLWHGAGWNFLGWGALHGAALVMHRHWSESGRRLPSWLSWPLTMAWVLACWIPFRAADAGTSLEYFRGLLRGGGEVFLALEWWAVLASAWFVHWSGSRIDLRDRVDRLPSWLVASLAGMLWAAALSFAQTSDEPFIYFQF